MTMTRKGKSHEIPAYEVVVALHGHRLCWCHALWGTSKRRVDQAQNARGDAGRPAVSSTDSSGRASSTELVHRAIQRIGRPARASEIRKMIEKEGYEIPGPTVFSALRRLAERAKITRTQRGVYSPIAEGFANMQQNIEDAQGIVYEATENETENEEEEE